MFYDLWVTVIVNVQVNDVKITKDEVKKNYNVIYTFYK